jgi:hypothetical protein
MSSIMSGSVDGIVADRLRTHGGIGSLVPPVHGVP